jgi:hypothetical protein
MHVKVRPRTPRCAQGVGGRQVTGNAKECRRSIRHKAADSSWQVQCCVFGSVRRPRSQPLDEVGSPNKPGVPGIMA